MNKTDSERDKRMANPDIVSMESVFGSVTLDYIN